MALAVGIPGAITGEGKLTPRNAPNALLAESPSIAKFLVFFPVATTAFTELDKTNLFAMTFSYPVFMAVGCSELCKQFTVENLLFARCASRSRNWAVPLAV
jgi:hypothetical protein